MNRQAHPPPNTPSRNPLSVAALLQKAPSPWRTDYLVHNGRIDPRCRRADETEARGTGRCSPGRVRGRVLGGRLWFVEAALDASLETPVRPKADLSATLRSAPGERHRRGTSRSSTSSGGFKLGPGASNRRRGPGSPARPSSRMAWPPSRTGGVMSSRRGLRYGRSAVATAGRARRAMARTASRCQGRASSGRRHLGVRAVRDERAAVWDRPFVTRTERGPSRRRSGATAGLVYVRPSATALGAGAPVRARRRRRAASVEVATVRKPFPHPPRRAAVEPAFPRASVAMTSLGHHLSTTGRRLYAARTAARTRGRCSIRIRCWCSPHGAARSAGTTR